MPAPPAFFNIEGALAAKTRDAVTLVSLTYSRLWLLTDFCLTISFGGSSFSSSSNLSCRIAGLPASRGRGVAPISVVVIDCSWSVVYLLLALEVSLIEDLCCYQTLICSFSACGLSSRIFSRTVGLSKLFLLAICLSVELLFTNYPSCTLLLVSSLVMSNLSAFFFSFGSL